MSNSRKLISPRAQGKPWRLKFTHHIHCSFSVLELCYLIVKMLTTGTVSTGRHVTRAIKSTYRSFVTAQDTEPKLPGSKNPIVLDGQEE